jgi:hypothetical protein
MQPRFVFLYAHLQYEHPNEGCIFAMVWNLNIPQLPPGDGAIGRWWKLGSWGLIKEVGQWEGALEGNLAPSSLCVATMK